MWFLSKLNADTKLYLLRDKQKYVVGRKGTPSTTELILADDDSISRTHAYIFPDKNHVKIVDCGSKYGTYINENIENDVKLQENKPIELVAGDRIRFGALQNIWTLNSEKISTVPSTLTAEEKKSLAEDMRILNGTVSDEWSEQCTHLTISNITVTTKVLHSLAYGIPIVKPKFWKDWIAAIRLNNQNRVILPDADAYIPDIIEPYMTRDVSFAVNIDRRRIFLGKTFIFMIRKQMDLFESIIKLSGGECVSLDEKKIRKTQFLKPNVIMIMYNIGTQSQSSEVIGNIVEYVSGNGLRVIPDCEISLAILHCSLTKFCNPQYKFENLFDIPTTESNRMANAIVLAPLTSSIEPMQMSNQREDIVIPETIEEENVEDREIENETPNPNRNNPTVGSELFKMPESANDESSSSKFKEDTEPFIPKEINIISTETLKTTGHKRKHSFDALELDEQVPDIPAKKIALIKPSMPLVELSAPIFTPAQSQQSVSNSQLQNSNMFMSKRICNIQANPINSLDKAKEISTVGAIQKRSHISLLADNSNSSDSDDNCFQFGNINVPKKRKTTGQLMQFDSIFSKSSDRDASISKNNKTIAKSNDITTDLFSNQKCTIIKSLEMSLIDGWLMKTLRIKEEDGITAAESQGNQSIKHYAVQIKTINVSVNIPVRRTDPNKSNCKNFKLFVKNQNYPKQNVIIRTHGDLSTTIQQLSEPCDF